MHRVCFVFTCTHPFLDFLEVRWKMEGIKINGGFLITLEVESLKLTSISRNVSKFSRELLVWGNQSLDRYYVSLCVL